VARVDNLRLARQSETTFAGLVRRFEGSPEFAHLRESTQAEYRRKFRAIDREWGDCPISGLTDKDFRRDVLEWRDRIAQRAPREADNLVSAMARVLAFGVDRGEIDRNALAQIRRAYRANRADKIWLPEHIKAFTEAASPEMRAAIMLAVHTGQRQADLLALRWSAYDGTRIELRQSKTGRFVSVRCTAALKAMLDQMLKRGPFVMTTPSGRPWKKRYFSQQWDETCKAAGIADLHFHDLRGTAITLLAEAGATVPEIAAVTGHNLATANHILDAYLSRTQRLGDAAIIKFNARAKRLQRR
jgi:integrase